MMDKTYLITVRGTPKSVNDGGGGARVNHFAGHREKKRWEGLIMMELLAARVPKPMQFCTVSVTLHFKNRSGGKGRDVENFRHPVIKPLADALVAGGYIKDDREEWFVVGDFKIEVGPEEWPFYDPRLKSYMDIKLEAQYL